MLHSLKTVLERIPKWVESYDLIFECGDISIATFNDVAWKDISNLIDAVCSKGNGKRYKVQTILLDLDLRYFLIIKLGRFDDDI